MPTNATNAATNFINVNDYFSSPNFALQDSGSSGTSFSSIFGNASTQVDASWEFVFSPGDYTNNHVIFETGGNGDGTTVRLLGNTLSFIYQDNPNALGAIELTANLQSIGSASDFYHVVAVAEVGTAGGANAITQPALYVNGVLIDSLASPSAATINDWAGDNQSGIGGVFGNSTAIGLPNGNEPTFASFNGDIAILRHYNNQVLTQQQVSEAFADIALSTATVAWDAADYTSGNWATSSFDASVNNASTIALNGSGTANSGSSNFANINNWVSSPNFTLSGTGGASFENIIGDTFTDEDATIEAVFRPGDFSGSHVLFEVGGDGDGLVLKLIGSTLSLRFQSKNTDPSDVFQVDADLSTIGDFDDFFHIVGVMDVDSPNALSGLYVNGNLIGSAGSATTLDDWAGANGGSVGVANDSVAGGGSFSAFDGDIAIFRVYGGEAFDQTMVDAAYGLVPEPSSMVLLGLGGLMLVRRRRR